MKLIIQIPCLNEESTIREAIGSLPKALEGIDSIEIVIIDDGSTDKTAQVAREAGADEVVRLPRHMGLAEAFSAGVETALRRGADILVNTDADLQYPSEYIGNLIQPILNGTADIALGDRLSHKPRPFSPIKMFFERMGSAAIRFFSGTSAKDAASGFRAFSREVLESLIIHGSYSYTLESLILAGMRKFRVANVTIPTNKPCRKSRLMTSVFQYIGRSSMAIIRAYLMYHPLRFFAGIGMLFITGAFALGLRFLYYYFTGGGAGHIQSLILLALLAIVGFLCIILGLLADVVAANRRLLEDLRITHLRKNSP